MSSKALGIANSLASMFGSGSRQGDSPKQAANKKRQYDMAGEMAAQADPVKRKAAAGSLDKAFGK